MNNLVDIKLHGVLGEHVGKNWKMAVSSVGEAMRAIELMSKQKLYKFLHEGDSKGLRYRVLINGRDFLAEKEPDMNDIESIKNSELLMISPNLKTVDVVPILEGADSNGASIGTIIAGALLITIGILISIGTLGGGTPLGVAFIFAGVGLLAAGVINLLTPTPEIDDFREIEGGGRISSLFQGPQNVTKEGGPVPILYGEAIVGSQVIAASYEINYLSAATNPITV